MTVYAAGIYADYLPDLEHVRGNLLEKIEMIRMFLKEKKGLDPVEHCLSRIKSDSSMREKCRRKGLLENSTSALFIIHDAIGIRIVCPFIDDVYAFRDELRKLDDYEVYEEKDYIAHAKENGYRSYHMILRSQKGYFAEIQLRTISMDTWAALEHQLKYKKGKTASDRLILPELKRCADELASTDLSMQTIRDMIYGGLEA